eukprot:g1772.t1
MHSTARLSTHCMNVLSPRQKFLSSRTRQSLPSVEIPSFIPNAVSSPSEIQHQSNNQLTDEERVKISKQTGYRSIGKELPDEVTLPQIVKTLPEEVFEIDNFKAWRSVFITFFAVGSSLALVGISPWYLLPFTWTLAGTAATGLFVIGHDCGHRSFSENKLVEDIVGSLCFAPLVYPFEPWRIKHNHHHAHTNKLEEDTAWHPLTQEKMQELDSIQRPLFAAFLASPLKCWASIGHWWELHFDKDKFTAKQLPKVIISWSIVGAFALGVLPFIVCNYGWWTLVKFWLVPWLGYHFWMSTFTMVHHTAPHIPFKKAEDWNAAKAQLSGSVHCDYPAWVDFLTHDISWHVPHHVSSKIPWYNLRTATESLRENWGEYMTECTFNWRMMKSIFTELHLYDAEKNYIPMDHKKEWSLLRLQRALLPDSS